MTGLIELVSDEKERRLYFVTKWTTLCSIFYRLVAGVVADTSVRPPSPFHRHLMFRGSRFRRVETEGTSEIIASRRVLSRIDEKKSIQVSVVTPEDNILTITKNFYRISIKYSKAIKNHQIL